MTASKVWVRWRVNGHLAHWPAEGIRRADGRWRIEITGLRHPITIHNLDPKWVSTTKPAGAKP